MHKKPIPYFRLLSFTVSFSLLLLCWIASSGTSANNSALAQSCPPNVMERFGINVALEGGTLTDYPYDQLNLGWWMDYQFKNTSTVTSTLEYVHTVRSSLYDREPGAPGQFPKPPIIFRDDESELLRLEPIIEANLGAIWLIGNEPDHGGQDSVTAEEYARIYHDAYNFIKNRDSTAQIAFGGTSSPTKLRQKYLDRVLTEYRRLYGGVNPPADIVHVHAYIMSEVGVVQPPQVSWGHPLPPGFTLPEPDAMYVAPKDHWNLDILKSDLKSFRQWMATNGYQEKPLFVSEYGILMPDEWDQAQYGGNEVGTANFMRDSSDFFLESADESIGLASDDNRLVQKFSWFSLNFPDDTAQGPLNGALFVPNSDQLTDLGEAYKSYTEALIQECGVIPPPVPTPTPATLTLLAPLYGDVVNNPVTFKWTKVQGITSYVLGFLDESTNNSKYTRYTLGDDLLTCDLNTCSVTMPSTQPFDNGVSYKVQLYYNGRSWTGWLWSFTVSNSTNSLSMSLGAIETDVTNDAIESFDEDIELGDHLYVPLVNR